MPRTKLCTKAKPFDKLRVLIGGRERIAALGTAGRCRLVGVKHPTTAKKYIDRPEELALKDLIIVARRLDVPPEDLLDAIKGAIG